MMPRKYLWRHRRLRQHQDEVCHLHHGASSATCQRRKLLDVVMMDCAITTTRDLRMGIAGANTNVFVIIGDFKEEDGGGAGDEVVKREEEY
ncbi:unnamed protein product [Linum trigynum]|uniref:Uncharacterized protein n=1 Tax=Linum trigynum TaxID=586398 RepID=A0AAV2FHU5_9ROSI